MSVSTMLIELFGMPFSALLRIYHLFGRGAFRAAIERDLRRVLMDMRLESFQKAAFLPFPISGARISSLFKIYLKKTIPYKNSLVDYRNNRNGNRKDGENHLEGNFIEIIRGSGLLVFLSAYKCNPKKNLSLPFSEG